MDLLVRAGNNDHTVIERFLAPPAAGIFPRRRQPIGVVVADAHTAALRPQLQRITRDAGTPYVVDPLTPLLQSQQAPDDAWAQLPFAYSDRTDVADLSEYVMDEIIDQVFTFQREHGATHLIPPYFYSAKRGDAWWLANRAILRRSASYLHRHNIGSPVIPVLAASLREYGATDSWANGVGDYLAITQELNTEAVALSWSWNEPPKTGEAVLSLLLTATERAAKTTTVIGWRAGLFGAAMVAVGAGGYETGIGAREYLHYTALANQRKPRPKRDDGQGGGASAYVYLTAFGRSIKRPVATRLLQDPRLAGSLVCSPDRDCCPNGVESMKEDWRGHAIRERRRELEELERMPSVAWRLNEVEKRAQRGQLLAETANEVLQLAGESTRVPSSSLGSLARVSAQIRAHRTQAA